MSAWNVAWGLPGILGSVVYVVVQILLDKFSPLVRLTVMLIAALASFATAFIVAKLQGNRWPDSAEGGMVIAFLFLLGDLSICSMFGACRSSVKQEADLRHELKTAATSVDAFARKFGIASTKTK